MSGSAALLRQAMWVICRLVGGTCSSSGWWTLHGLLHIVLLKCAVARHTSEKLEKNPLFYNANDHQITLWSKYVTLRASRAHNYKLFPKRVSPRRVGNYWFMSDEWRRKGCTFGFHFWTLEALYSQWTWVGLIHCYVFASHRKSAMLTFAKEVLFLLSLFQKIF